MIEIKLKFKNEHCIRYIQDLLTIGMANVKSDCGDSVYDLCELRNCINLYEDIRAQINDEVEKNR